MTGREAWSIIAPILAAHSKAILYEGKLNPLDEAYVLTFGALKEYDDRREDTKQQRKEAQQWID